MNWIDGCKFIGQWSKEIVHGYGRMIMNDKTPNIGIFENNSFIKEVIPSEINEFYLFDDFNIYSIAPDEFKSLNLEKDEGFNFINWSNYISGEIREKSEYFPQTMNQKEIINNKTLFENYEDFFIDKIVHFLKI